MLRPLNRVALQNSMATSSRPSRLFCNAIESLSGPDSKFWCWRHRYVHSAAHKVCRGWCVDRSMSIREREMRTVCMKMGFVPVAWCLLLNPHRIAWADSRLSESACIALSLQAILKYDQRTASNTTSASAARPSRSRRSLNDPTTGVTPSLVRVPALSCERTDVVISKVDFLWCARKWSIIDPPM